MDGIKIEVTGNIARVIERPARITAGMVGLPVEFSFDDQWDGLSKTAAFRAGNVEKISENLGTESTVPWEVLENPNAWLSIGVYGVNDDGTVAIPTIWANVCVICEGVNPDGDASTAPTLPVWQRLWNAVGNLLGLTTNAKDNLVEAINEVHNIALAGGIETDTTLTEEGKAAEARATGDEFARVWDNMQAIDESHVGVDDVIDVEHGGTGATNAADARTNLDAAAVNHNHSAGEINSGTLPVERGGTGGATAEAARKSIGAGGNENLLDNWYLANPVNQRGATKYTADEGYTVDRWRLGLSNSKNAYVTVNSGYVTLHNETATSTSCTCRLYQKIGNPGRFSGKTVTASVKLKNVTVSGYVSLLIYADGITADTFFTSANTNGIVSATLTLPSNVTSMYVAVGASSNNGGKGSLDIEIEAVKLELGSVSTLANDAPPKYSEQLLECQRYYIRYASEGGQWLLGASNGSTLYAPLHLPVPLRVFPSAENGGSFKYANVNIYPYVSGGKVDITGLSLVGASGTQDFMLYANHASNALEPKQPGTIRFGTGGYVELSAEI